MKRIKLLEVRSELGAGTRGSGMGIDALRVACLNKGSDYFRRFNSVVVPDLNHVLFDKTPFPFAKHIDAIYTVQKGITAAVEQTLRFGEFPLVLAGDHSSANATIAGIKAAYPTKTLGVIWIDAHADIHSPYTTPSGNVHGMPLAAALGMDNRKHQRNIPDAETEFFWRRLQNLGEPGPKLLPEHLVYVVVRDTEEEEDALIEELGIKWIRLPEIKAKGSRQLSREIYEHLRFCDLVYISFDVDSLDSSFSIGTGTPVEDGLYLSEAENLCQDLLENDRVVCFEMVEINPTLDNGNTMAKNAFNILEKATDAIEKRLRLEEVVSR
ncbi:arginase [Hymenobacter negativus]|uniref:Arginase n=1 Tax=Hymenobacter negativus TaxID=2795026 RepID=A0ABS0QCZ1_9BACT|nr:MULTISPECIES: arginase [Bacteria]MBH8560554.1 arginase [Hymenobacter negativus]MBH8570912.1 arginase [Hymenobacter negativus]MBR7210650.1 arginase [Microvirga sp. STS02]